MLRKYLTEKVRQPLYELSPILLKSLETDHYLTRFGMSMEDVEIVKVLYDYDAEDETCLTLRTGDIIYVINRDESGWYDGVLSSGPFKGKRAWFPSNFTKPIEKTPPTSPITNDQLPTGWKQKIAKDGSSYYYNLSTYQTVTSKEEIPKNPRQSMLLLKASSVDFEELRNLSSLQEQEPQAPTTDEQPKWDLLINEIFRGISDLNDAAKVEDKSKFLLHTSDVIKAIRELLINCSALRKDSPILAQHPQLRPLHIQLLSNTAKLVLAAKIASGIYPKPKSTTKMRYQAGQVLSSVRNFVAITQDLNIPLNSVFPENKRKTTIVVPITSDFELVKKLDVLSNNILTTSTEMISYLVQDNQINQIILLSKSVVDQVGQVFSLIDELKVNDLLNKEMISLVDDFKLKREILYECINDLITTTSTLLDSYAPNNTNKLLQKCLSLLMRSSENVIVCTKILIDKKQDYEQQLLEIEIQGIHDPNRDSMDLLNFFKSSKLVNTENSQTLVKSESKDSLRSISSYGYDPMELILNIDGQISGGTLTALVERLTLHDMTIDPLFMSSFLQTFRLFTTQIELLSLLKLRFNITPSHTSTQKWQTIKQTPVRLRVFNVLKTWIELYLTEGDMGYYEEIMGFITTTIRPIMPSMAMRVIETLKKKRDEIMVSVPHPKTPKLPKMIRNSNVLVQLDYADVAKQITIMETELFNKLLPEDLINYVFSPTKNVKVSKMTLFSTQVIIN